ncbi:MAPK regulated corepressor interacting protein 2 [Pseudolycoriella hygida]|uniref:MAPK regulated corepressor interacting protein 2 n=1 Tax=Pseudolycoriella hygida TaxID=35572 RepID=A0A9Q0SAJ8_9DIPT|nr:MAPK regulated corepressor interacting protein 2 [Pseudolycoriella hygida]
MDRRNHQPMTNPKRIIHQENNYSKDLPLHNHDELIKYVNEAWHKVQEQPQGVTYYKNVPEPRLNGFKAFDLESWWGRRVFNQKTS